MPPRMAQSTQLEYALAYAAHGWHVFPCVPGGKVPLVQHGHLEATADPEQIRRWWQTVPDANIGISLEPSGLVALDVDVAEGKHGAESLDALQREIGVLPISLTQRSARGGAHVIYTRPKGAEAKRSINFRPGLDLLGKGYILAQPSRLVGEPLNGAAPGSNGAYTWVNPDTAPVELPPQLTASIAGKAPSLPVALANAPGATPGRGDRAAGILTGDRNNALFRLGCALRDTGIDERALVLSLMATNAERLQPPLDESEVLQIATSVMQRVSPRRDVAGNASFGDGLRAAFSVALDTLGQANAIEAHLAAQRKPDGLAHGEISKGFTLASEVAHRESPPVRRYPTGIGELDRLTGGGISTRQLLALLGKPGAGKSAFLISLALQLEPTIPILYASTELESDEIAARLAAPIIGCPWKAIIEDPHHGPLRARMREVLATRRIAIIGCDEISADGTEALKHIAITATRMFEAFGLHPAIVVDYIQDLARGAEDSQGVRFRVGGAARLLRIMAQALDCPVVAVSSVGRTSYGNAATAIRSADDPTLYLSAAKESGDIDYAAATVLYLDVTDDTGEEWRPGRVAVAKSRHGRTGFAGVRFHGATGRWEGDVSAVAVMSADAAVDTKSLRKNAEDDETVIGKVRTLSNTGDAGLLASSALREVCGINKGRAEKAISRCLADGRLVLREVQRVDRFHKTRRVMVVDVAGRVIAAPPPVAPVQDPALSKLLGFAR